MAKKKKGFADLAVAFGIETSKPTQQLCDIKCLTVQHLIDDVNLALLQSSAKQHSIVDVKHCLNKAIKALPNNPSYALYMIEAAKKYIY